MQECLYFVWLYQIVDDLSLDMMAEHDLPVDIIVTPRSVFTIVPDKLVRF